MPEMANESIMLSTSLGCETRTVNERKRIYEFPHAKLYFAFNFGTFEKSQEEK